MTRRLLNLLTILPLLLCVASAALWVRSHRSQDVLRVRPQAGGGLVVHVFWQGGSIACTRTYNAAADQMPAGRRVVPGMRHHWCSGARRRGRADVGTMTAMGDVSGVCPECGSAR